MAMFSEIYGAYFEITAELLRMGTFTSADLTRVIAERGFRDTPLFLPSKIIPQPDESDWKLFRKNDNGSFSAVTNNPPLQILTTLQKRWLKAKLCDPRMRLFLSDEEITGLYEKLADVLPLYLPDRIRYTDRFTDGDDYESVSYRNIFRTVLEGVRQKKVMKIAFKSGKNKLIKGSFVPLRLEYSQKNDRFRLYCTDRSGVHSTIINVGRMLSAELTEEAVTETDIDSYFEKRKCREPVTVRVTDERKTIDRFLMEFASFEKRTERIDDSGECIVQLWYDRGSETEILIQLLSFGPTLEILAPARLRKLARERIVRQYRLTHGK